MNKLDPAAQKPLKAGWISDKKELNDAMRDGIWQISSLGWR